MPPEPKTAEYASSLPPPAWLPPCLPIKGMLDGLDALLSIVQMPPGIPVATVGVNGAMNAAILAVQMLALSDTGVAAQLAAHKESLKEKIVKANAELASVKYKNKVN